MNRRPLYEYKPHEFTGPEKRFLAAAGWAAIPADDALERSRALLDARPLEIERVTFLTRELLRDGVFAERRRAYDFARALIGLLDAGADLRLVVWDWE